MTGDDKSPDISVVICTFKRPIFLKKCIQSVLSSTYEDFEIIIVGQGADGTPKMVVDENFKKNPKIKYIHTGSVGLSHARNEGCKNAKGNIIAFIDDDAVATPEWLEGYAEAFEQIRPKPAMVGGKIEPDWEVPRPKWYPEERQFLLGIYNIGDTMKPFPEQDLPIGANFAVLKSVIEDMGGFDSKVGFDNSRKNSMIAGEDSLLGLKVRAAGFSIYYQPKAKVFHHVSSAKLSKKYFLKRHFWEGVTHMVLEERDGRASAERMMRNFIWHLKSILSNAGKLLCIFLSYNKYSSDKRMLKMAEIAYSFGVCTEAFKFIFRYESN